MHLSDQEQDLVSEWLGKFEQEVDLNVYFYQGETDVPWLLHAVNVTNASYINLDRAHGPGHLLASYILAKGDCHYFTSDENYAALCSYINKNRVGSAIKFLERVLSGNRQ